MPADLNPYGGVFGGWIVSQMALGAGSEASRRVKGKAVLVTSDMPPAPDVRGTLGRGR